jgi:preprotein translocase subunit SecF
MSDALPTGDLTPIKATLLNHLIFTFARMNATPSRTQPMNRLAGILFSLISTTLMGTAVVVALTMGQDTLKPILVSAAIGFIAAIPITWYIAKKIMEEFA